MSRTVRIVLATFLLAGAIAAGPSPTPAEAQALPDGVCDTSQPPHLVLIHCADEAAAAGLTVSQLVARYGWAFAGGAGVVGLVLIEAWGADPPESMGECLDRFPELGERGCDLLGGVRDGAPSWWTEWMSDALGSLFDPMEVVCAVLPILPGCASPGDGLWDQLPEPTAAGALGLDTLLTYDPSNTYPDRWSVLLAGPVPPAGEVAEVFRVENPGNGRNVRVVVDQHTGGAVPRARIRVITQGFGNTTTTRELDLPTAGDEQRYFAVGIEHQSGSDSVQVTFGNSDGTLDPVGHTGDRWSSNESGPRAFASSALNTNAASLMSSPPVFSFAEGWGIMGWVGESAPAIEALREAVTFLDPLISPGLPEVLESPFPEVPAPPAVPVPWDPPGEVPAPAPVPEAEPYSPVTEGAGDQGLFDQLANRIGGIIDGLASSIGGAFGWLGDLISELFSWLVDRLWEMFHWLFDSLEQLIEWLGELLGGLYGAMVGLATVMASLFNGLFNLLRELFEALGRLLSSLFEGLGELLGTIGDFILGLPQAIFDLFSSLWGGITGATWSLPSCEGRFPCSWVAEASEAVGLFGDGLTGGLGGCTPPSVGWSEFQASFPAPSGCSSGNPGVPSAAESAGGDLFGYRVPLRMFVAFGMWLALFRKLIMMTPWARTGDFPLNPAGIAAGVDRI